jgi:hypothetical protein
VDRFVVDAEMVGISTEGVARPWQGKAEGRTGASRLKRL